MATVSAVGNAYPQSLRELQWQDHVCLVYDAAEEWTAAVARFLTTGLERGEGCLCLLPEDFFSVEHRAELRPIGEAAGGGGLLHWHDAPSFRQFMRSGGSLAEFLADRDSFTFRTGCRVVCDMTWLKESGLSEKLRFDFLEWLKAGRRTSDLLVMSGYRRCGTSPLELRNAFGVHRYIFHSGQLLPGGFRGTTAPAHGRRFDKPVAGWRSTFRRSQLLDAMFHALPFAVWILDANREIVFVNRRACGILGLAEEQLVGRRPPAPGSGGNGGADYAFALDNPSVYQAPGPVEREQTVMQADGCLHDYRVIHTRIMGDDGQVQGLLGLAMDMTGCRKAERLLKESEERFRDIALSVGDLIWEVGADWRFRYLSEQAGTVLGCAAEQLVGKSLADLDRETSGEEWRTRYKQWKIAPRPFRNVERWVQCRGDAPQCLLLSGVPVVDENGHFDGYRGVAEDITGRKQQEDSLKRALWEAESARDRIDRIVQSISEALVVIDNAGRVVMFNPRAESLFGVGSEQAAGRPFGEFCPESGAFDAMMKRMKDGKSDACQACLTWHDGSTDRQVHFKARASRVLNMEGQSTGAIVIFQDMTREREMERVKTEFISTAAHELRTPLTSIMGYLEFCMHPEEFGGFPDAQLKEFMAEIYDKAEVLERIVSDLLDISRIEAGREIPLVMEPVDVAAITRKLLQHFQLQFPRYRFEMEFPAGISHQVRADREKLVQVMENLISNAVKYSAVGSPVRVTGRREADTYRISVRDEGIGMSPAQIERMFERFYRAVDVNSGVRGLGLGMHIVKHIIERHGGRIEVSSAPRQGTEIVFHLPLGDGCAPS